MELMKWLLKKSGCESVNQLSKKIGIHKQTLYRYLNGGPPGYIRLDYLCMLRKDVGVSWEEMGKRLDKEFLE